MRMKDLPMILKKTAVSRIMAITGAVILIDFGFFVLMVDPEFELPNVVLPVTGKGIKNLR